MPGIFLLTIGALNAVFAVTIDPCTQGGADSLYGGWLTLFFYIAGSVALIAAPPARWLFILLVPAALVALWHSWFAASFAYGFWLRGMSACFAMQGGFAPDQAGEWMDGGEPLLTILWLALSLTFWVGTTLAFRSTMGEAEDAS